MHEASRCVTEANGDHPRAVDKIAEVLSTADWQHRCIILSWRFFVFVLLLSEAVLVLER